MVTAIKIFFSRKMGQTQERKKYYVNKKNPHEEAGKNRLLHVDNVDNYIPSKCSPTFTMSPAPIVINRSPFIHFFNKKFSISSKEWK